MSSTNSSEDDSDYVHTKKKSLILYAYKKKRAKPRFWLSNHIKERPLKGLFYDLHDEQFKNYFRVSREQFQELLSFIEADILKENTNFRKAISPQEKLAVCLRFLATGDSFKTIAYNYRMSAVSVSRIVLDTCIAIWERLQPIYMKIPTKHDWENIADAFEEIWQFKNCLGAIDGKHVAIKCPPHSGSSFFNYKFFYSVVLLAVVDAHKRFIIIDVGSLGRFSDGGIFNDSVFGKKLINNELDLPADRPLVENSTVRVPYVFIGDKAFALRKHLLRPYPNTTSADDRPKRIFNYRLSRARNVVENAFGILSTRWRVYRRPLECRLEIVDQIIKATCLLHNYLSVQSSTLPTSDGENDNNNERAVINDRRRATREAFNIRNMYCNYFNNSGRLHFQDSVL